MKFTPGTIDGAWIIDAAPHRDHRGSFARLWCQEEFRAHGVPWAPVQANLAHNAVRGTLRGMHWQAAPHQEGKLVRCGRGVAWFVLLDLRDDSPTRHASMALELVGDRQLWAPPGCALGYQTLADDTEVWYLMTHPYVPQAGRGLRYNDPAFGLSWPLEVAAISAADQNWPDYRLA